MRLREIARKQNMKSFCRRHSFAALPCTLFSMLLAVAVARGAKNVDDIPDKSLLRVAEKPAKPDTKKYELRYKVKRGDVLRYDVTHKASIRTTIDTTTQAAQTKTDSVKAWKITDVLPGGDIEITNVVEKVHMVNQLPDKDATEYDSTTDKVPPPGFEDAAKAVGVPLSVMRITPRGKIVKRESKIHGQGAESDAPIVLRLPEKKVVIGDTWDEPFEVQVLLQDKSNKTIQTRRHHKLTDVNGGIATIQVTYQVLSPIDSYVEMQMVQRLMDGEVQFDIAKGQLVAQQMDVDKRVIGFAGPTSSMQYIMKMEEELLKNDPKMAAKSKTGAIVTEQSKSTTTAKSNNAKGESASKTAKDTKRSNSHSSSKTQTATKPRSTQSGSRTTRR
jgi:hypothetical protein